MQVKQCRKSMALYNSVLVDWLVDCEWFGDGCVQSCGRVTRVGTRARRWVKPGRLHGVRRSSSRRPQTTTSSSGGPRSRRPTLVHRPSPALVTSARPASDWRGRKTPTTARRSSSHSSSSTSAPTPARFIVIYYLRQGGYVFVRLVCLFVCLNVSVLAR